MLTGNRAAVGPTNRVPPGAAVSATRSYTSVVKPAGIEITGKPCAPSSVHASAERLFTVGSTGAPSFGAGTLPVG